MAPSIAPATGVGAVHIAVSDAEQARRFYRDYVGLTELPGEEAAIRMGSRSGRELVVLHPGASGPVPQRRTGLYHLALLVPDRRELARVIGRLASLRWQQSPTDHVMTKANYLWDPDGNGIEIYAESPEDGFMGFRNGTFYAVDAQGRERSGRDPIDLDELFSHLEEDARLDEPLPPDTKMGHVHLHVADVDDALRFYHDLIGFDVMGHVPGVAFVSAGGYHHHLGLNTWAGRGAPPPPEGVSGLREFTVEVPSQRDLEDVAEHLEVSELDPVAGFAAADPSGNQVRVRIRPD